MLRPLSEFRRTRPDNSRLASGFFLDQVVFNTDISLDEQTDHFFAFPSLDDPFGGQSLFSGWESFGIGDLPWAIALGVPFVFGIVVGAAPDGIIGNTGVIGFLDLRLQYVEEARHVSLVGKKKTLHTATIARFGRKKLPG